MKNSKNKRHPRAYYTKGQKKQWERKIQAWARWCVANTDKFGGNLYRF